MGTTKRVQNIFGRNATKNRDFFGRFPLGNWSYCAAMAHPEKKKMIGKPNHLLQHYFWCHTTSSSRPQAKKVVVVRCQMIGVPNPIITFFGFDQYRQNYWIRTQNGEQVSRVVVIVYQKSLNLCGKNCILSCSRGRRSRLFVVTASLSHTIEKLHNFLKRPEC